MNAKELRIGNACYKNGKLHLVTINDIGSADFNDFGIDYLKPIPLTSAVLKKCGLTDNPYLFTNSDGDPFYLSDTKIKYLHQLQNVYFDLNDEELLNIEM
jgi:hypothetical protein